MSFSNNFKYLLLYVLFIWLIYIFLFGNEELLDSIGIVLKYESRSVFVIFLGIILEAFPFIILGVVFSSIIQEFVSEDMIRRLIPKNPITALFTALFVAILTPVCECAIIPVVRRLIQKGVPVHAGTAILLGAPILNFIVFGSTFYAFQGQPYIYIGRIVLCIVTVMIVGVVIYLKFSSVNILRTDKQISANLKAENRESKLKSIANHSINEFFLVGKYFMIGAFFASIAQIFINRYALAEATSQSVNGVVIMMGLAFLLSLCSEADAFVAASFQQFMSSESLLAFLVYGPMIDLKNTLVMIASFKMKFVVYFIALVTIVVFVLSLLSGVYLRFGG
ncbi:permease [Cytobacillus horneckiae]|uniref:permease n=1 Tax=Cytobacillus horneckiae TaxID=549687 RepID=UPI00203AA246|nr:permease [Cytobacillus horneckiae]MCM3177756.1 permease [Cytobacillus horneckiae]